MSDTYDNGTNIGNMTECPECRALERELREDRARIAELERERAGLLARVLKAVADEPECPDPMPDGMWMAMAEHKDVAEEAVRIAVRQTKAGIHDRIVKATSPAQAGKGEG